MEGIKELERLLSQLERRKAFTPDEKAALDEKREKNYYIDFLQVALDPTYLDRRREEMGALERRLGGARRERLCELIQKKENQGNLKLRVEMLSLDFRAWFEHAESIPPGWVWQMAVMLRKAKLPELELRLLKAWAKHIKYKETGCFKDLDERLSKMLKKYPHS